MAWQDTQSLQGAEFDAVKPLSEKGMHFRGEPWSHVNFWACSRSSKKIKRFFAEPPFLNLIRVSKSSNVHMLAEEPLAQYKRSCAFCESHLDILHPMNDSEFLCGSGNEEDWYVHQLFGLRFFCRKGEALPFPFSQYS
ncbi:hypothetical protein HU200_015142 [Digitaria exilis]|uniref:DUF3615 domain-containing protein n=1 Tax=Digitaria exilis TaxID=1010633 RepID=A0A835FAF7_9POAL|nr:hypothetical protein HU200_015142 [Digitaria exilis]